jgi:methylenetetrahydrofolate dehydrogenase (NADP+)/methenyltetrahydrofolate cyclohydrolase
MHDIERQESAEMSADILDGKAMSRDLRERIRGEVEQMDKKPGLAVILVGDDPASQVYVNRKIKACGEAGIVSKQMRLNGDVSQRGVAKVIDDFNEDPDIHGILLQLPLPEHLDSEALVQRIDPDKDVDGLTVTNMGRLMVGLDGLFPCTPLGAMHLIHSYQQDLTGMEAVVMGRSNLFGKPMAQMLLRADCTVHQAHKLSRDVMGMAKSADILVVAVGKPHLVKADWIKPGAIVIDIGTNRLEDGSLTGDVDFDNVKKIAGAISPSPGGAGPMTIAYLLQNTLDSAKRDQGMS